MDFSHVIEKIKLSIAFIIVLRDKKVISQGSGFVFLKKNILVTCNHVLAEPNDGILIKFSDQEFENMLPAKTVIQDKEHDLALLRFDDDTRTPLIKGDDSNVKEGIEVLMAGYPLNISSLTTHQGILSAITKDATGITTYLIDGTVNPGNSGCPLMNKKGEVIGVVNATRREEASLITKVQEMSIGALSLHGIDLVEIYQALIKNLQLGLGYAVPCSYIPSHHDPEIEFPKKK